MRRETTLLLVGKTGHGKSATGNSILGQKIFKSAARVNAVTKSCQMGSSELEDGRLIRVIDSPGFLDPALKKEEMCKEIAKGILLSKNGINAVFMVVSLKNRFSTDDMEVFHLLVSIFGDDILKYTCVLFTGGDSAADSDSDSESESDSIVKGALERMVQLCHGRKIVFDNVTKCDQKKVEQRQQLLNMIESISEDNGGIPFSNDLMEKVKAMQRVLCVKSDGDPNQNDMDSEVDWDEENSHTERMKSIIKRIGLESKDDADSYFTSFLMSLIEEIFQKLSDLEMKNSELDEEIAELKERLRKAEANRICSLL